MSGEPGALDDVSGILRRLDPIVWIVTARSGDRRGGMAATYVNSASISPVAPRVILGLSKARHTLELIRDSRAFALHMVDESRLDLVQRFGLHTGRTADKLREIPHLDGETGSPILDDAVAWLECRVEGFFDTGDRVVVLGEVVRGCSRSDAPPLRAGTIRRSGSPEMLEALARLMSEDAAIDEAAVREWRTMHHISS